MTMASKKHCILFVMGLAVVAGRGAAADWPPAPASSHAPAAGAIVGHVSINQPHAAARPASAPAALEIVVYLECTDPARRFDPPKTVARISQKGAQFSPSLLVICVGQEVD